MVETIRVLLADDHPTVRIGIRAILAGAKELEIVGEAADGHDAQRLSRALQPDVLLLDLSMPGPPAIETIAGLKAHCPQTKVLVLTAYDDEVHVRGVVAAGAAGYVLKDEAPEALVRAIRAVACGDGWYSRPVLEKALQSGAAGQCRAAEYGLSGRDWHVVKLIAEGWDNARIAGELGLAEQTVRNYVSRIYDRLGVHSRAEAIVWARTRGATGE